MREDEDMMTTKEELGPAERRLLGLVEERLMMGQKLYGAFDVGSKNWDVEALEEIADALVYLGARSMQMEGLK